MTSRSSRGLGSEIATNLNCRSRNVSANRQDRRHSGAARCSCTSCPCCRSKRMTGCDGLRTCCAISPRDLHFPAGNCKRITGASRASFVPAEIAAEAALGLTSLGERSEAILEMALTADRPNATTEMIRRYIDDANAATSTRIAAVNALGRVGTTHAREILARLAQRRDDV